MVRPSTKGRLATLFFLFAVIPWLTAVGGPSLNWNLHSNRDGILIEVAPTPGSSIRTFRATTILQVGHRALAEFLIDPNHYSTWMPDTSEVRILETDPERSVAYFVSNTPWPAKDRDGVYESTLQTLDDAEASILINIRALPDRLPPVKGKVRIPSAEGFWLLRPISPSSTKVTYQFHCEPGASLPSWIVNQQTTTIPKETFINLRKLFSDRS
ncbi:MAG: START domain-containing protein [Puniceicoccaceae bacterium]